MSILLTANPASLPVTAGQAYTSNDIRTLAIDASADDTMTNWKFPECSSKPNNRISFPGVPGGSIWVHARIRRLDDSFRAAFEFYGLPSGYSSSSTDYWGFGFTKDQLRFQRNGSVQATETIPGGMPANNSPWFDVDLQVSTGKLYVDGVLMRDYANVVLVPKTSSRFQFEIVGGEMTEIIVADEDTRGWRLSSYVPESLVSSEFSGDLANIQTPGLTEPGLSSEAGGTRFVAKMPVIPAGYKVAGQTINTITETNGTPDSPMLAYIHDGNLLGFHTTDSDGENLFNSFIHMTKPSDGSVWTVSDLSEREITVLNPVEHFFDTTSISGVGYGTTGSAQFVKGGEWEGGGFIELQHAYSARTLWIFCDADTQRKWGTSDKIHVYYTRRDVSGQSVVNRTLTWDDSTGGYKTNLDQSDFDAISGSGRQMKLYIVPL